jgi:hypothetical protein
LIVIGGLQFDRRGIAAVFVEAVMVEPVTQRAVANSTSSMDRQGLPGLISSVLYKPLMVSARALS